MVVKKQMETYETIMGDSIFKKKKKKENRNVTDADPAAVERQLRIEFASKNPVNINDKSASLVTVDAIEVALSVFVFAKRLL